MHKQESEIRSPGASGLRTLDLYKSFRGPVGERLEVLRGLSFAVEAGEMVAVVGPSGAGKSTLLHLLGGLEAADAGSIRLDEFEITRAGSARLSAFRGESVGFVFQAHHLLADLTAAENVALPLLINRSNQRESMTRAAALLKSIGLGERLMQRVGLLSGGEQQRVALARALVKRPRMVLADEPTGNLDTATGDEIAARLASFCEEQRAAVVVATHNERVANLCHRVLVLREGKLEEVRRSRSQPRNSEFAVQSPEKDF